MNKNKTALYLSITAVCALVAIAAVAYSGTPKTTDSSSVLGAFVGNPDGYIPETYMNMGVPADLALLADGNIWYVDEQNARLVLVSPAGQILRTVGRFGTAEGEFADVLTSITRDASGNLYVLDVCHVYKLDSNGGFIKSWGECYEVSDSSMRGAVSIHFDAFSGNLLVADAEHNRVIKFTTEGVYLGAFGVYGTGNGEMYHPQGIATDATGKIYVVDGENHRTQVFDTAGNYLLQFGSVGSGDGQFTFPKDVLILSDGRVAVTSQNSQRVQIFNANGTFDSAWGETGTNAWQFLAPRQMVRDASDNIYISDWMSKSIQKFSSTGVFISGIRNSGKTNGKLTTPTSIAYDAMGNMYILDDGCCGNGRVQKFTNAGTYLETVIATGLDYASYHIAIDATDKMYISHVGGVTVFDLAGNVLSTIGVGGTGDGEFQEARDMAFDSAGNIYVADYGQHRVQKFDSSGTFLTNWGTRGTGNGEFGGVGSIAISGSDEIYVAEFPYCDDFPGPLCVSNSRVQVFDTFGTYIRTISSYGELPEQLWDIGGIALDSTDTHLYVSNTNTHSIKVFSATDGTYIDAIGKNGSGPEEFTDAGDLTWNPITDTLSIADGGNHRVQTLNAGSRIFNLISSADVSRTSDNASLVTQYYNVSSPGIDNIDSRLYFGQYVVSDFTVDLSSERNWEPVAVNALINESKALVSNLNPTDAPGISATHSLYLVKQAGQTSVHVCPDAAVIADLTFTCPNGYDLVDGVDSALSTVTIDTVEYWRITGLTGTGALSPIPVVTTPPVTTTTAVTGTPTATPTPSVTVTNTPTPTPTPTPTVSEHRILVTTLMPVANTSVPECPSFDSFTASATMVQKGENVTLSWTAVNTEVVTSVLSEKTFNPVDTYSFTPTETTIALFVADNGRCTAKKEITINVVETLPWTNSLAVGAGALAVEAIIATQATASFGNMWLAMASFVDRRKKRSWGYVYNAVSKKPIARAVIRLLEKGTGRVVDTVVSEANGAFRVTPKVGTFVLKVSQANFSFPSKTVTGDVDGGFTALYHGEDIKVEKESNSILLSIPMDPISLSSAQASALRTKELLVSAGNGIAQLLLFGGLAYTLYMSVMMPHLFNYVSLVAYSLIVGIKLSLTLIQPKVQGKVTLEDGTAIAGVEIGLYDVDFKNLLYRTFTTNEGMYSFAVINNTYKLKLMDSKYTLLGSRGETLTEKEISKNGNTETTMLIAQDLKVLKS